MSLSAELAERLQEKGLTPVAGDEGKGESPKHATGESPKPATGESNDSGKTEVKDNLDPGIKDDDPGKIGTNASDGDQNEGEEVPIELLTDLADYIGTEPDRLYSLKVKMPDGETAYSVGELKDLVQQKAAAEQELATERQRLEAERQQLHQAQQQAQQQQATLNEEGAKAWQEMQLAKAEYERIDWAELEKIDPGRAALEKQNLLQRFSSSKHALEQAQRAAEEQMQDQRLRAKQFHDIELLKRVPEWKDPQKAMEETTGIVNWMRSEYQFSDQEIQSAIDWRYRDILRKAHAYDRMKAEAGKPGKAPIVISGRRNRNSQTAEERRYGEILAAAKKPNSSKEVKVAAAKAALERAFANKR